MSQYGKRWPPAGSREKVSIIATQFVNDNGDRMAAELSAATDGTQ